jgi:putative transcriptional regulator
MAASVLLFTDRDSFVSAWRPALEGLGMTVTATTPDQLPERLAKHAPIVIDAMSSGYDEDELLAHLGLARALGAVPAVMMPAETAMSSIDELVDDLCAGLVARTAADVSRVATVLARRAGSLQARRFEYLTVSPRGGELLAILADGTAFLAPRPVHPSDDLSEVMSITLADDALHAAIELSSGARFELGSDEFLVRSRHSSAGTTPAPEAGDMSEVDGQRLGSRIRALRLAAGLTQAELARRTGIHRPNIARVEAGRHTPSLETLSRLASAIGVPTTRVLTGE